MAFTPDPETTWSTGFAGGFAGALANPGIKLEMSQLIGKFDYNAGVYKYESVIGVERGVEINPNALVTICGFQSKLTAGIFAAAVGNYELLVSEYTSIQIGNTLELSRSTIDYSSNREYKGGNNVIYAFILIIALADLAAVLSVRYGFKDDDSSVKIAVGVFQGLNWITMAVLHVLEAIGVEALGLLKGLVIELTQIIERLNHLVNVNSNLVDILNPLLTDARVTALKGIVDNTVKTAKDAITIKVAAVAAVVQGNPGPCWVARAVYGPDNPRWILFRQWLFGNGPVPEVRTLLQKLYMRYGQSFAMVVDKSPCLRSVLRLLMDLALYNHQKKAVGVGHAK
jgi:hypothetical protein